MVPFVAFGNDELAKLPATREGDAVRCPRCGKEHRVEAATDTKTGKKTETLLFYSCGQGKRRKSFVAAVAGRCVMGSSKD